MGTFDTIKIVTPDSRIICAHGHELVGDFQSKDLGEGMSCYCISNGYLCVAEPPRVYIPSDMPFTLRADQVLIPLLDDQEFEMHTTCHLCVPVYTRSIQPHWITGSFFIPHWPYVSLVVRTELGRLTEVIPRNQTRDDLRTQLAEGGSALIADDDPMLAMEQR